MTASMRAAILALALYLVTGCYPRDCAPAGDYTAMGAGWVVYVSVRTDRDVMLTTSGDVTYTASPNMAGYAVMELAGGLTGEQCLWTADHARIKGPGRWDGQAQCFTLSGLAPGETLSFEVVAGTPVPTATRAATPTPTWRITPTEVYPPTLPVETATPQPTWYWPTGVPTPTPQATIPDVECAVQVDLILTYQRAGSHPLVIRWCLPWEDMLRLFGEEFWLSQEGADSYDMQLVVIDGDTERLVAILDASGETSETVQQFIHQPIWE